MSVRTLRAAFPRPMKKAMRNRRRGALIWVFALAAIWALVNAGDVGARGIESRGEPAKPEARLDRGGVEETATCSEGSPIGANVEFEGWQYIPIFEEGDVQSIVVLATDPGLRDDNIASMWFIREGDSWSGYSWGAADHKDVLEDVKDTLGLSADTDSLWPVDPELRPDGRGDRATRQKLETGLFSDDPFLELVQAQEDPTKLLSALVDAGWRASDADVFESECRRNQLLDGLAEGFVVQLEDISSGFEIIDDSIDLEICEDGDSDETDCTVSIKESGNTTRCTGTFGPGTPGTQPLGTGGCITVNRYKATVTGTQTRTLKKTYADCTVCTVTQTRTRTGTTRLKEQDVNATCPPPANYTSPPASRAPCSMANISWGSWGAWTPPGPGEKGSACP
ncbi:MAG: hypothetical protein VX252_01625 [Myxococcota bacterium]|nr:hypothetical protein [Myxococcota bacterium]